VADDAPMLVVGGSGGASGYKRCRIALQYDDSVADFGLSRPEAHVSLLREEEAPLLCDSYNGKEFHKRGLADHGADDGRHRPGRRSSAGLAGQQPVDAFKLPSRARPSVRVADGERPAADDLPEGLEGRL